MKLTKNEDSFLKKAILKEASVVDTYSRGLDEFILPIANAMRMGESNIDFSTPVANAKNYTLESMETEPKLRNSAPEINDYNRLLADRIFLNTNYELAKANFVRELTNF